MAVAYDASSASFNDGTSPVSWTHTPVGTPKGVLVFVFTADASSAADDITGVTYGGVAMTAVSGGFAQDSAGEPGFCKAYFLGSSVPTGAQTVSVSFSGGEARSAVAITVTAGADTEVYTSGIVLLQGDGTIAEQSVDDGSPGTNSVRFAGLHTGLNSPPAAGANSTVIQSSDYGVNGSSVVRENTAGQGSRSIGWSTGSSSDRAAVHLAVRESSGLPTPPPPGQFRALVINQALNRSVSF